MQAIEEFALTLGFAAMAAISAEPVGPGFRTFYGKFLAEGIPEELAYLERQALFDPSHLLPGASSVLLFAYPYRFRTSEVKLRSAAYKVARYAWQRDYHYLLKEKLGRVLEKFGLTGRAITDSAPFPERYWARRSGLGKIGRNGMLIAGEAGSYFLIASLVITDDLGIGQPPEETIPREDFTEVCASCRLCVDACPTGALAGDGLMRIDRCISYQTIESRSETAQLSGTSKRHAWIFGCDICQQVCPWNRNQYADDAFDAEHPLAESIAAGKIPLSRSRLAGSAFHRRGPKKLQQNIAALNRQGG